MSLGVDLDNLGPAQFVPDDGSGQSNPPADLAIAGVLILQDTGAAQLSAGADLGFVGGQGVTNQDLGAGFFQGGLDTNLGPAALTSDSITDAWWQMTGFDTVALREVTWTARTPLFPPPTQHPVINISAVRITAFLPQTNGT